MERSIPPYDAAPAFVDRTDGVLLELCQMPPGGNEDDVVCFYGLRIDTSRWEGLRELGAAGVIARVQMLVQDAYDFARGLVRRNQLEPFDLTQPGVVLGLLHQMLLGSTAPQEQPAMAVVLNGCEAVDVRMQPDAERFRLWMREADVDMLWYLTRISSDGEHDLDQRSLCFGLGTKYQRPGRVQHGGGAPDLAASSSSSPSPIAGVARPAAASAGLSAEEMTRLREVKARIARGDRHYSEDI